MPGSILHQDFLCVVHSISLILSNPFPPFLLLSEDVRSWRGCGEEEEAMRKSVSPLPGDEGGSSAGATRVFGVPLDEVTRTHTIGGHEVPALVKHIVDYIEEHGE